MNTAFAIWLEEVETGMNRKFGLGINDCTDEAAMKEEYEMGTSVEGVIAFLGNKHGLIAIN